MHDRNPTEGQPLSDCGSRTRVEVIEHIARRATHGLVGSTIIEPGNRGSASITLGVPPFSMDGMAGTHQIWSD